MNHHENKLTLKQRKQILNTCARIQPFYKNVQIGEQIAFLVLVRMCRDYCDPTFLPCLKDKARKKMLIKRLEAFKVKYNLDV